MRQGCRTWVAVKWVIAGGSEVVWVFGMYFGVVLLVPTMYVIILELPVVVLGWAEQGIQSTMTNTSRMMWQLRWVFWSEQGSGELVGGI